MATEILSSLKPDLALAHRIVETLVLRTKQGAVFTIDIGESILPGAGPATGAKVTLTTGGNRHIGICEGSDKADVIQRAQQLIAAAIQQGVGESVVPKPHIRPGAGVRSS